MKISVCSIMRNERLFVQPWLQMLLEIPDIIEIILVDAFSDDMSDIIPTIDNLYPKSHVPIKVIKRAWENSFAKQRNFALAQVSKEADWVFFPDLDEHFLISPLPAFKSLNNTDLTNVNQIIFPYVKFYDMQTLWFFKDDRTPNLKLDKQVHYAINKSTTTIFKKQHLKGFEKDLHEMPTYNSEPQILVGSLFKAPSSPLERLSINSGLMGHYDQAKHFLESSVNKTTVEYEMGKKRKVYREINPVTYNGKVFDKAWSDKATTIDIEELGMYQLESFLKEHEILKNYDASKLHNKWMKNLWANGLKLFTS